jgi:hypothetical protein
MRRALLPVGVCAFLLAVSGIASASPGESASATFTVSVEVVRSCTVQTAGGGSVDCHGQTPSTMQLTTSPAPAPLASSSGEGTTSHSQVLTILF